MATEYKWTQREKTIARRVYDRAYEKECTNIYNNVKAMLSQLKDPREIWKIEDYLDGERTKVNGKYDYRYSVLVMVFGRLMKDGLIDEADLYGLDQDKIEQIKRIGPY